MMRRHELDPVSLTFGFAFTGLGLLFLLGRADQALRLHWVWPLLLLVLGAGILLDLARSHPDPEPQVEVDPTPPPEVAEDFPPELGPDPEVGGAVDSREPPS
jgi:hypothetical protein